MKAIYMSFTKLIRKAVQTSPICTTRQTFSAIVPQTDLLIFLEEKRKENIDMKLDIARAWKDKAYRQNQGNEELALLPENLVGELELTDKELAAVCGGDHNGDHPHGDHPDDWDDYWRWHRHHHDNHDYWWWWHIHHHHHDHDDRW